MPARAVSIAAVLLLLSHLIAPLGRAQVLSGPLASDTVLTADAGPWLVQGLVVVGDGVTLEISAGTEVRFEDAAGLRVQAGGTLRVTGTPEARVLLTRVEDSAGGWEGVWFEETLQENLLQNVDIFYGDGGDQAVLVDESRLLIDGARWTDTDERVLAVDNPRLIVRNSDFPASDGVEPVNGQRLEDGEYFILRGNTFRAASGYNDIIDFSDCKQPGPILEVYDNLFLGGSDDGLDIDGCDAHIEGNTFIGFHKGHGGSSTSNAIATGFRYARTTDITVVRNIFIDNDHAILLKEDAYAWAEHNVFYGSDIAAINFSEWPDRDVDPARGAYLAGNIFMNNEAIFQNLQSQPGYEDPVVVVNHSILPDSLHGFGERNLDVDPQFVDPTADFHLAAASPAREAGPLGLDMGAYVPSGARIVGPESGTVTAEPLRLEIGGPGITAYRYAVNDTSAGAWSGVVSVADQPFLILDDLEDGEAYTVHVQGRSFTGVWQANPAWTSAGPFVIDPAGTASERPPERPDAITVAPNPVARIATIHLGTRVAASEIYVHDLLGRRVQVLPVKSEGRSGERIIWDAGSLAAGIYLVSVRTTRGYDRVVVVKAE